MTGGEGCKLQSTTVLGIYTVKKGLSFSPPRPAGMSLTKLSLTGKDLIIPGQGEFG
jgi:hypothetical protein